MPPTKIQPIDIDSQKLREAVVGNDSAKPVLKSRLRRLFIFDRQSPTVLRNSSPEKLSAGEYSSNSDGGGSEFEPSSLCLAKMVQNFIEETNEKQPPAAKCGRNRCNCFNGNNNGSSDDELDVFGGFNESVTSASFCDASDVLKSLIPCATVTERNLLADISKIVENNNKVVRAKDNLRNIVADSLSSLGYDSSVCISRWDKTSSYPAGEHEFIDVIVEGERLLVDIDFRSEFEIARSTGSYKAILQLLPHILVGKSERFDQIVSIVSEAAKQSLKKKGMHFPPWRKAEYMRAKWLSAYTRTKRTCDLSDSENSAAKNDDVECSATGNGDGELELIFREKAISSKEPEDDSGEVKPEPVATEPTWKPPAIKPKRVENGAKVSTGLASLLKEKL
ncbi:uncharacterized protein LOC129309278 [Prosopis cineraria]|uniref:uncharacterized protein LOC129309278 n=1 Tax=Prosopis cineraria TaxID=364024 RepID=UPI00240F8C39|nr:uncharacterized protein LOC129309278 [Prosopis cineraria]XP_054806758.1 uncharacterized protein LOC129309278 [Prosopis cineraria]